MFELQVKGVEELKDKLNEYPQISEPVLQKAIDAANAVFAKHSTRPNLPWKTGNLLQSFRYESGHLEGKWYPTAHYAGFVHDGTGIFGPRGSRIYPKNRLALYWPGAAYPVRSIKGQKAQPFLPKILESATGDLERLFGEALDIITQEIAK